MAAAGWQITPRILYKYYDLRGLDIPANLRLNVTPFNEFNDPFELAPRMNFVSGRLPWQRQQD
jgi:hypothetical protein